MSPSMSREDVHQGDPQRPSMPSDQVAAVAQEKHCKFCLLAEFDIDKGSTLTHQYPEPTGYDEHILAELMLPDGVHVRVEDWTIFFLKQSRSQSSSSSDPRPNNDPSHRNASIDEPKKSSRKFNYAEWSSDNLTYVINLVRTKHDNSVRRGALVKAMAIGTSHPFIDVFKPALLLALDDYFKEPGIDCLARLYYAINQLDLSPAPTFTRAEKLILRASDRRDLFEERFIVSRDEDDSEATSARTCGNLSGEEDERGLSEADRVRSRSDSTSTEPEETKSLKQKPSTTSLRPNVSTRVSLSVSGERRPGSVSPLPLGGKPLDTHFFDTSISYRQIPLPIRVPLTLFPEEVGEYSLIKLIQTFSGTQSTPVGPLHPHLHSNGPMTHPIILLFNALITQKRVVFLGHGQPAHLVASYVLAACALGSGCGVVFRGFAARAFPYTNLTNLDELEKVPGYIAGVTNPRFEDLHAWDVLLNIETGKITVSKDIASASPPPHNPRPAMTRDTFSSTSLSSLAGNPGISHDGNGKVTDHDTSQFGVTSTSSKPGTIGRDRAATLYDQRADAPNNMFMDEINSVIQAHYGERYIRCRITDFVSGFAKAAARHEEHFYGHTSIGPTSQPFLNGQLGSGPVYSDRETELKEIQANQMRTEGFRASIPYKLFKLDENSTENLKAIRNFDPSHQVARMRRARNLAMGESDLIFETIANTVVTVDQITELLSLLPPHGGGLLPLAFGLFHPNPSVRNGTVDFFLRLCSHPMGKKFVQSLNTFQRLAFARLVQERTDMVQDSNKATAIREASRSGLEPTLNNFDFPSPLPFHFPPDPNQPPAPSNESYRGLNGGQQPPSSQSQQQQQTLSPTKPPSLQSKPDKGMMGESLAGDSSPIVSKGGWQGTD